MILQPRFFLICLVLLTLVIPAGAKAEEPHQVSLQAFRSDRAKAPVLAVLTLTLMPGRHVYGNIQGPSGFPTVVTATSNATSLITLYPPPVSGPDPLDSTLTVDLYNGPTPFFLPLGGTPANIKAQLRALLCSSTTCQPIKADLELQVPERTSLPRAEDQSWWPRFRQSSPGVEDLPVDIPDAASAAPSHSLKPRYFAPNLEVQTLSKAAMLAFLAGLILNFMPCALPVITLKLRSFLPAAGRVPHQRQAFRSHNLFFALGMMLYFGILAAIFSVTGMAWGQIFQQTSAIITLTAIVFALSLSLFGVYDLPLIDLKGTITGRTHHPRLESFTTGILATILATPCSGPFLGGVLAWTLIQPPDIIAMVLSCIGLGMASPYLAMALFPGLYRYLPKPGPWTMHLERILGFLLAATCVYLFSLLPTSKYVSVLVLLWVISLAAWMWGQWTSLNQTTMRRWSIRTAGAVMVILAAALLFRHTDHNPWQDFTMAQFKAMQGQQHLILDFTADWCPNCKFLEKTVLTPAKSAKLAQEYDAILLRVDLTRHDPEFMALLESLGSKSIPILAIFPKDNPDSPLVLRDLFTSGQLKSALEAELKPSGAAE